MIQRPRAFGLLVLATMLLAGLPVGKASATNTLPTWGTVPRGMADAYVAGSGTVSGVTYNPAISSTLVRHRFTSDFSSRQFSSELGIRQGSFGVLFRNSTSSHALLFDRQEVDFDFDNFSHSAPSLNLNVSQNLLSYNFGSETLRNLHLGYTLNYLKIQSSVEDGEAAGWGADLGFLYEPRSPFVFGLSARNILGNKKWSTGKKQELTTRVRSGIRLKLTEGLELETGGVYDDRHGVTAFNSGLEWWLYSDRPALTPRPASGYGSRRNYQSSRNAFAFRFGLERDETADGELNPAFGFTAITEGSSVHYSYRRGFQGTGNHSFGLAMNFGG